MSAQERPGPDEERPRDERDPAGAEDERRGDHRFAADEEAREGAAGDTPARTPGQGA